MMDPRGANHLDPDLRGAHWALERWGAWVREDVLRAWPQRTVLGRIADEGPGAGHVARCEREPSKLVLLVERAVCSLSAIDQRVLREEYTHWQPVERSARRAGLSTSRYRRVLWRPRWRVRGFIDGAGGVDGN